MSTKLAGSISFVLFRRLRLDSAREGWVCPGVGLWTTEAGKWRVDCGREIWDGDGDEVKI